METSPLISVVIPVYCRTPNHQRFLTEALESVASQTFRDFEVVLVDDFSPLDIEPLVEAVNGLPPVRLLRNSGNTGHAYSRNRGVRESRGTLIAFLDHDDLWLPDKLARQLAVLEANPDAALVFCDLEFFGPQAHRLKFDQSRIPERPDFTWFAARGNYVISATAVLLKKQALLDIGLFDTRYTSCDDFDAWLKILMTTAIVHFPEKLARYRLHAHNLNYAVHRLKDNKLITALIWRYWRERASSRERLQLLPQLARKLAGRLYFTLWPEGRHRLGD